MAKKFGKFLAFTAIATAVGAGAVALYKNMLHKSLKMTSMILMMTILMMISRMTSTQI